jgi:hypothetical protein
MRRLRSVREVERVNSVPGLYAITTYALRAPNRFSYTNALLKPGARHPVVEGKSVVIGQSQWQRQGRLGWRRGSYGAGLPFRTHSWFTWTTNGVAVRLLSTGREQGRPTAVVGLMDPGTPAWWRLHIDLRTLRVTHSRLIATAHFMTQRFYDFNAPVDIRAPRTTRP